MSTVWFYNTKMLFDLKNFNIIILLYIEDYYYIYIIRLYKLIALLQKFYFKIYFYIFLIEFLKLLKVFSRYLYRHLFGIISWIIFRFYCRKIFCLKVCIRIYVMWKLKFSYLLWWSLIWMILSWSIASNQLKSFTNYDALSPFALHMDTK